MHRIIALVFLGLVGLSACRAEPDEQPDVGPFDMELDAQPMDASPPDMFADADPRSLAGLWSPDFGPPPDDMPEEIRWMHGRMWCDGERPPRILADGSSECEHRDVNTPTQPQVDQPINGGRPAGPETIGCRIWPHRTSEFGVGIPGGASAIPTWVTCDPEMTVCCSFIRGGELTPCGWPVYEGHVAHYEGEEWVAAQGRSASIITDYDDYPQALLEAFPRILNNCHPICKPPTCPGD